MSNEKKSNSFEHFLGFFGLLFGLSIATEDPEINALVAMIFGYAGGFVTGSIVRLVFNIVIQVITFCLGIAILIFRFNNILNLF